MASTASQAIHKAKTSSPFSFLPRLLRLALLVAADSFVIWFLLRLLDLGYYPMAAALVIIAAFVNYVLLRQEA